MLNEFSALKCVKTNSTEALIGDTRGIRIMRTNTPANQCSVFIYSNWPCGDMRGIRIMRTYTISNTILEHYTTQ